jgi:hypothetical protein
MLLRGGPLDGHKIDGRRVRGATLWIKDSTRLAKNEIAEYRRSAETGTYEFVRTSLPLLNSSPAGQRVKQLRRGGMSYEDALAQAKREQLAGVEAP